MENTKHTKSAGGVILNPKKEVLIVNQDGTSWSLPKGHIIGEENFMETTTREIREESGITDLKFVKNLGNYTRYALDKNGEEDKSEIKMISMFLFSTNEIDVKPSDLGIHEVKWVKKEEVEDLLTHPKDKEFFVSIKKQIDD